MTEPIQIIISVLALLGLGGILGGYITYLLDNKKERESKVIEQKEKRYKSCLLYMDAYFKPENIKYLSSRLPDIRSAKDVLEYLKMEYHEMMLYASKEVILSVKVFIEHPTPENFLRTILIMRSDLSSMKYDLIIHDIQI